METMKFQRHVLTGLALMLLLLFLAGCGRIQAARANQGSADIAVDLQIIPEAPATQQASTLQISLRDRNGGPIDGATVTVEGDMTHAGMTPVLATARPAGGGRYTAALTWTMAGDWQITVKATLADGRTAQRAFPLRVGEGH